MAFYHKEGFCGFLTKGEPFLFSHPVMSLGDHQWTTSAGSQGAFKAQKVQ